ncbi:MAG: hypothetical protein JNL10_04395 [Verrucomicrobiales bacterium]|nr:hypothetical protein [Verrucomicrobiales bacterium]
MSSSQHASRRTAIALNSWRKRVHQALDQGAQTPFFLFSAAPVSAAYETLGLLNPGRPQRCWFSAKTQPLEPLWTWWHRQGGGIEVVSEREFEAARAAGFSTDEILINGPAKHRWLPRHGARGLRVHFDSPFELKSLLPQARREHWKIGLRICTPEERDPEHPSVPTQFGFSPSEVPIAVRALRAAGLEPDSVHFHLRTNVSSAEVYRRAIHSIADLCAAARWTPSVLDVGGGLPPPDTRDLRGHRFDADMDLRAYELALREAVTRMPFLKELWMEHGRFVCAGSGVLVIRILDSKSRAGLRQLICDGGRTLHALVSTWEQHGLHPLQPRRGAQIPTAVFGPTCMAFDCLARQDLPRSLRPGDALLWMDAGAYHLPWETRFSHELAEIWWEDEASRIRPIRRTVGRQP